MACRVLCAARAAAGALRTPQPELRAPVFRLSSRRGIKQIQQVLFDRAEFVGGLE